MNTPNTPTIGSWRQLLSLSFGYSVTTATFNTAPLLVGGMLLSLGLQEDQAGLLLTLELVIMAATAFLLAPFEHKLPSRWTLIGGALITLISHGLSTIFPQYDSLLILRAVSGFGAGLMLLGINARVAASDQPVRLYGIITVAGTIAGSLLLTIMPEALARFGLAGAYGFLAVVALVSLPLIALAPSHRPHSLEVTQGNGFHQRIEPIIATLLFAALILVQVAQGAYFSFTESLGARTGLSIEEVGLLLALSYLLCAIPGSGFASWLGYRWGKRWPLFTSLALNAASIMVACSTESSSAFTAAIMLQAFAYFVSMPYQLGLAADLDKSGRLAAAAAGVLFFGLAIGPVMGGYLITQYGYLSLGIVMVIATAIAIGLFYRVRLAADNPKAVGTAPPSVANS